MFDCTRYQDVIIGGLFQNKINQCGHTANQGTEKKGWKRTEKRGVKEWKRGTTQDRGRKRKNKMADSSAQPAPVLPTVSTPATGE